MVGLRAPGQPVRRPHHRSAPGRYPARHNHDGHGGRRAWLRRQQEARLAPRAQANRGGCRGLRDPGRACRDGHRPQSLPYRCPPVLTRRPAAIRGRPATPPGSRPASSASPDSMRRPDALRGSPVRQRRNTHSPVLAGGRRGQPGRAARRARFGRRRSQVLAPVEGTQPDPDGRKTAAPEPVPRRPQDRLRQRLFPVRGDRAGPCGPDVRRVEDQPPDHGSVPGHPGHPEVVLQRRNPDRDRQQHRLVHQRGLRRGRPGRIHPDLRALLRSRHCQAGSRAIPAGLRPAWGTAGADADGREQPAGRLRLDLHRLLLPDSPAGTAGRHPRTAGRGGRGRHPVGRVTGEVPSMHITTTRARAAAAAVALLAGLAVPVGATAASASPQLAATPAAHSASAAGRVPHFDHIVVLMLTEHGFTSILRSKYAPTLNRLASEYGLATHYYTTSDPDTAGVMAFLAGNSYGVTDSSPYWDQPISKPSLLSQLDHAHKSWKEYVQDIPYAGYLGDCYPTVCQESDALYKQAKFNPVPDFTSVADNPAQARKMVPALELATDART